MGYTISSEHSQADEWFALMGQGESAQVEFKQSFGNEAIETVCALMNVMCGGVSAEDVVLALLLKEGGLRLPELSKRLNIPVKTLEKWVAKLKKSQMIERGAPKTGGYYVIGGGV